MSYSNLKTRLRKIDDLIDFYKQKLRNSNITSPWSSNVKEAITEIFEWMHSRCKELTERIDEEIRIKAGIPTYENESNVQSLVDSAQNMFNIVENADKDYVYSTLYDYVSMSLEHLDIKKDEFSILFIGGAAALTVNYTIGYIMQPLKKILKKKQFHVIYVEPMILLNPSSWPTVLHEVGHIIGEDSIKSLTEQNLINEDDYHYASKHLSKPNISQGPLKWKNYLMEEEADLIATILGGHIYPFKLYELYERDQPVISDTHPDWDIRFRAITSLLEDSKERSIAATDFKKISDEIGKLISNINTTKKAGEIDFDTYKKKEVLLVEYLKKYNIHSINKKDYNICKKRLKEFKPVIAGEREIVTSAYFIEYTNGFSKILKIRIGENNIPKSFGYLVEDCLRLSKKKSMWISAYNENEPSEVKS